MDLNLKASLNNVLQDWLDENADNIGDKCGIYQDDSAEEKTAMMLTNACEVVIDSMGHQVELQLRFG